MSSGASLQSKFFVAARPTFPKRLARILTTSLAAFFLMSWLAAASASASGASLAGTIIHPDTNQGIPNVLVIADGQDFSGQSVSDETGAWSIPVPAEGAYQVTLDADSLPRDTSMISGQGSTIEVVVQGDSIKRVLFRLEAADTGILDWIGGGLIYIGAFAGVLILGGIALALIVGANRTTNTTIVGSIATFRWVGTTAVVSGVLGIAATFLLADRAWTSIFYMVPWIFVITGGLLVRFLSGQRSVAAGFGLAVVSAIMAGPVMLSGLVALRWRDDFAVWPGNVSELPFGGINQMSGALSTMSLILLIASGFLLLACFVVPLAAAARVPSARLPRSAFRIEVLALIFVLVLVGVMRVPIIVGEAGAYAQFASTAFVLSWLVPLAITLALLLRNQGMGSLWVAVALALILLVEPFLKLIVSPSWDRFPQPTLLSDGLVLPALILMVVLVLWNTQSPIREPLRGVPVPLQARLEPWSAVALLLSIFPPTAIPALILGHVSYERIVASDRPMRGRLLAGSAMVIAILSLSAFFLVAIGAHTAFSTWIAGW